MTRYSKQKKHFKSLKIEKVVGGYILRGKNKVQVGGHAQDGGKKR